MRVLVSGASGMIGSAVCDALLARGDEVVGLSRDPNRARETNPTVNWHRWDPANERPPETALEGADAVVNLIGEEINQRLTDAAKQRIRESRVRATKNLVDGILASGKTVEAKFVKPVPVYIVYFSTAALTDGSLVQYDDLYKRDGRVMAAE